MRLYNTMSSRIEEFIPKEDGVRIYVCGPTPHARAHVGHAKSYISFDILRRYMEWKGLDVRHVMCITDVAEEVARKADGNERAFAHGFEELFFRDMSRLGNLIPSISPRISDNVDAIVETVQSLVSTGHAREKDGRVVLPLSKEYYGPLSHARLEDVIFQGEEDSGTFDILLWDPTAHGMKWPSPWGAGRPGWHIQCYTMIKKYLGVPVDLHGGGLDLVFPHHESENMVSRLLDGVDSSRFWVHNGLMMSGAEKMSKSRGSAMKLGDMLDDHSGGAIRLMILSTHYRHNTMLSVDSLERWGEVAKRLKNIIDRAHAGERALKSQVPEHVEEAMENDLHTEVAVASLVEEMEDAERHNAQKRSSETVYSISKLLGLVDAEF